MASLASIDYCTTRRGNPSASTSTFLVGGWSVKSPSHAPSPAVSGAKMGSFAITPRSATQWLRSLRRVSMHCRSCLLTLWFAVLWLLLQDGAYQILQSLAKSKAIPQTDQLSWAVTQRHMEVPSIAPTRPECKRFNFVRVLADREVDRGGRRHSPTPLLQCQMGHQPVPQGQGTRVPVRGVACVQAVVVQ